MCNLEMYIEEVRDKYGGTVNAKRHLAKAATVKSLRTVDMWTKGEMLPDVIKAQRIAQWLGAETGRRIEVGDIWPANNPS